MKYLLRLIVYLGIFFATFSTSCVVALRFIPVTITPVKVFKLAEHRSEHGFKIRSNWVGLDRISESMQRAVIATEDNKFLEHNGFDYDAIRKAMEENKRGKRVLGASTISQQTAKNLFCIPSRSWIRKGIEAYYTVLIEFFWSKRRIMEVYLNIIETHPNVYGVQAAANIFFDSEAGELTAAQAAMIATVLPSPARMDLSAPSEYMWRRSATVQNLMKRIPAMDYRKKTNADNNERL